MSSASSSMIQIQLPDGTVSEHSAETTAMDVATGISEGLARSVVLRKKHRRNWRSQQAHLVQTLHLEIVVSTHI